MTRLDAIRAAAEKDWTQMKLTRAAGETTLELGSMKFHWDRELSNDEMNELIRDPWQMFKRKQS